jgi:hypothetical protein
MVWELNRQQFGIEVAGQVQVSDWPPLEAVLAEIDLEHAKAIAPLDTARACEKPAKKTRGSLEARALAIFIQHSEWTIERIAEELGTNKKCLTRKRCPKLAAAIAAYRAGNAEERRRVRGSKDKEGHLEAYINNDDRPMR